jgi:hypothetical protein
MGSAVFIFPVVKVEEVLLCREVRIFAFHYYPSPIPARALEYEKTLVATTHRNAR